MIGIVGAGITGLSLSIHLEERGVEHRVFESSTRPGGVIRSERCEGRVLDFGPQRTRVTPPVGRLLEVLGLSDRSVSVPADLPLYVLRGGRIRRVPFKLTDLLATDLLSVKGKLRLLLEPWTSGYGHDETVGDFLVRKFGREAYENLMGPLFGGLYGSDPGQMYVRHSLAETMEGIGVQRSILWGFLRGSFDRSSVPPAISFLEGMQELTDAMHRRVQHRVSLGSGVESMEAAGGDGWTVSLADGERVELRELVLTVPAGGAARLLDPVAPAAAGRLAALAYNRLAVVHLLGNCELRGLGYQVAYGEPRRTRGVTWNASALGRDGVYTAFLGGARDPDLLELDDVEIGAVARREFEAVTGCSARVLRVSRTRVPSWDRSWTAMEELELPPRVHLCSNYESRVGIPGRLARTEALAAELAASSPSS